MANVNQKGHTVPNRSLDMKAKSLRSNFMLTVHIENNITKTKMGSTPLCTSIGDSGSGIWDQGPFWPLDPRIPDGQKKLDPDPGWTTRILFPKA